MSSLKYFGSVSVDAMWPLLALGRVEVGQAALQRGENSICLEVDAASVLDVRLDNQGLRLCLKDAGGELLHEATAAAWGDQYSEAFWFPFGPFEVLELPEEHHEPVDLGEIVARTNDLLNRVTFYDREPIMAPDGREAAAIDYLRLTSGVTEKWIIAMAAPHELILDDPSIGGGHGLLLCFGELPPGLADLGECALVQEEPGSEGKWWMRPVMCTFENDLDGLTTSAARSRLDAFSFTAEEVERLDRTAEMVRADYAAETAGEMSGVYSG